MGLSHAFGCFKDPEARALKKQRKAGKRTRNEETRPNRVITTTERGASTGVEMRSVSDPPKPPFQPAIVTVQDCEPPPPTLGDDELEPWSVGAVIRRTSMIEARRAEAAEEREKAEEEKVRFQAMVEEDLETPSTETKLEVVANEMESEQADTGEAASRPDVASTGERGGSGVHATMVFGLPTRKKEKGVDLKAIPEEAELRRIIEENNALAAKASHNGKYGGAISSNPAYNQRAAPVSQERDTKKSGWSSSGLSGSFASAMHTPYYDYEVGTSGFQAGSPAASGLNGSQYGYGGRKSSYYAYVSGPAN
jgi:hypothetical protein